MVADVEIQQAACWQVSNSDRHLILDIIHRLHRLSSLRLSALCDSTLRFNLATGNSGAEQINPETLRTLRRRELSQTSKLIGFRRCLVAA